MPTSQPYIKLAAIASNEAFYLPLWVYHHFSMGFDILEIWINHTTDNSWNVINKLKLRYGNHLIIIDADNDALDCRKKNISFQKYAYNEIYKKTLEQNFTHLMFLDIDELWIDRDFKSSIKDFISEHKDVNISCFQWFLDLADKSITLDTFKFQSEITLQRNRHIKSLINLKSDIKSIGIHNHISNNGSYILGDGSKLNFGSSVDEGQISIDYYKSRINKIDRYFIFHRLYKSSLEYTASLLKSNLQTTESGVLKSNRKGYKRVVPQKFLLTWQIPNNKKRQLYDKGHKRQLNAVTY
ncbi:MAG: hypothetical protein CR991_02935 [Proteobacteria bacterium]|nr:MAG: hypothetical protein CR991_02935 [Pseudomonadota bacterium]